MHQQPPRHHQISSQKHRESRIIWRDCSITEPLEPCRGEILCRDSKPCSRTARTGRRNIRNKYCKRLLYSIGNVEYPIGPKMCLLLPRHSLPCLPSLRGRGNSPSQPMPTLDWRHCKCLKCRNASPVGANWCERLAKPLDVVISPSKHNSSLRIYLNHYPQPQLLQLIPTISDPYICHDYLLSCAYLNSL